jgi:hypothetical protein
MNTHYEVNLLSSNVPKKLDNLLAHQLQYYSC